MTKKTTNVPTLRATNFQASLFMHSPVAKPANLVIL